MNNQYLYEVSCYDCANCALNNYQDQYCQNACLRCYSIAPNIFYNFNPLSPSLLWYSPSQYPYGIYYGSYYLPTIMY